jgi:hypothetical protein
MNKIEFAENEAKQNATFHIANADALAKESNLLLNIVISGAGGSLVYFINLAEKQTSNWIQIGTACISSYLFITAAIILWKCLLIRPIYPPANEPKNLLHETKTIDEIRLDELTNRQSCIDENRIRNDEVGYWINKCRGMLVATPLIFLFGVLVAC